MNDAYELDLEGFVWTKIKARGKAPSARADHVSCAIHEKG